MTAEIEMCNDALFKYCSTFKLFANKVVESYFLFAKVNDLISYSVLTLNNYLDLFILYCKLIKGLVK